MGCAGRDILTGDCRGAITTPIAVEVPGLGMKLYIPPQDLFRYWRLTRRGFLGNPASSVPARWRAFEGSWPQANPHGVFFTACDSQYFELYAENYIVSVAKSGGRQSVHLHIYDGDDAQMARAVRVGCRHGVAVSVTRDRERDVSLYSEFLYAAGRFVILPSLLSTSSSPIICTDVDVLVRGSFDDVVAGLADSDVSLHLRPKSSLPWRKVLASTVIGMPTAGAQAYFDGVRVVLAQLLDRPLRHHVDQIVLYLAYRRVGTGSTTRFAPMAKQLIDWDFDECSLVWNAKGPERKPAYWRAAHEMGSRLGQPLSSSLTLKD